MRKFTAALNVVLLIAAVDLYSLDFPIQTRLQSRRRPASVAGTKRKGSCPAAAGSAVVGEAPLPPSSPFEHQVVVENLDVDLAPPSVVIREAAMKNHIRLKTLLWNMTQPASSKTKNPVSISTTTSY